MFNVIFSMLDIRKDIPEEVEIEFRKNFDFVRPLPESRVVTNGHARIMYQANVNSIEQLEGIKTQLEQLDDPHMIGLWINSGENSGLQQGYKYDISYNEDGEEISREVVRNSIYNEETQEEELETIYYPFNFEEYKNYLKDIKTYDEDGNETSSRRPTDEEARNTQVNRFGGMKNRDLNSY